MRLSISSAQAQLLPALKDFFNVEISDLNNADLAIVLQELCADSEVANKNILSRVINACFEDGPLLQDLATLKNEPSLESIRVSLGELILDSAPAFLKDPVSQEIMLTPVVTSTSRTHCLSSLAPWYQSCTARHLTFTDPESNIVFDEAVMFNQHVYTQISDWCEEHNVQDAWEQKQREAGLPTGCQGAMELIRGKGLRTICQNFNTPREAQATAGAALNMQTLQTGLPQQEAIDNTPSQSVENSDEETSNNYVAAFEEAMGSFEANLQSLHASNVSTLSFNSDLLALRGHLNRTLQSVLDNGSNPDNIIRLRALIDRAEQSHQQIQLHLAAQRQEPQAHSPTLFQAAPNTIDASSEFRITVIGTDRYLRDNRSHLQYDRATKTYTTADSNGIHYTIKFIAWNFIDNLYRTSDTNLNNGLTPNQLPDCIVLDTASSDGTFGSESLSLLIHQISLIGHASNIPAAIIDTNQETSTNYIFTSNRHHGGIQRPYQGAGNADIRTVLSEIREKSLPLDRENTEAAAPAPSM
jgi:hypothetical protein